MADYQFNVRFDLRDERERQAAEFLQSMKRGSRNRFVIEAISERIHGGEASPSLVDMIRKVLRGELRSAPHTVSQREPVSSETLTDLTPEEQEANRAETLAALEEFF